MNCPYCKSNQIRVIDTMCGCDEIYRRRKCYDCGKTFRTIEMHDDGTNEFSARYYAAMKRKRANNEN